MDGFLQPKVPWMESEKDEILEADFNQQRNINRPTAAQNANSVSTGQLADLSRSPQDGPRPPLLQKYLTVVCRAPETF